ncbi:MAG: hypothetical protein DA408_11835 [Bacteroidetes bacterium]|nr:MAG: hypothetical protein C7N36_19395 [Bacteroidota bacterium]PTM12135.1 MAG: hypothetical protein DA408_11835 [Bacteroidota bacterium]
MRIPGFYLLLMASLCVACKPATDTNDATAIQVLEGETMGTYYRISLRGAAPLTLQAGVDSLLVALNQEVSTYIPSSLISRFNHGDLPAIDAETLQSARHFLANLELSLRIAQQTGNAFNPTIMPLVNYWGFGYTPKRPVTAVDSSAVDSLMTFVGMDKIDYDPVLVSPSAIQLDKQFPGTQLDFSAIAKGYGVDLVASYLRRRGIQNYLVDIGGEVVASGDKGSPEQPWHVGIAMPREDAALTDYQVAIPLRDVAIATSGNYRNFYEANGQKYSHTINPFTGYPERSNLLSASILAPDCATADGYATACMVVGLEAAYALIDSLPNLEGYFIFNDDAGKMQTRMTAGFAELLQKK